MFEDVPRGGAVLMLLIEHRWALPLSVAVHGAGGVLSGQQMVPLATMERIPEVLARGGQRRRPLTAAGGCAHHTRPTGRPHLRIPGALGKSSQPERP